MTVSLLHLFLLERRRFSAAVAHLPFAKQQLGFGHRQLVVLHLQCNNHQQHSQVINTRKTFAHSKSSVCSCHRHNQGLKKKVGGNYTLGRCWFPSLFFSPPLLALVISCSHCCCSYTFFASTPPPLQPRSFHCGPGQSPTANLHASEVTR